MKPDVKIDRRLMGVGAMNPTDAHDSASRKQMYLSSHLSQCLVINGSTERRIQTGAEREFGKYTFSVKMPVDGLIVKVIDRYKQTIGKDSIAKNPQTIIIYENVANGEFDIIDLTEFHSLHQHFGFRYRATKYLQNIRRGQAVPAGTILLNSPAINDNGGYQFGRECNVVFMSHPAVAEDGVMVCRDQLPMFGFKTRETRVIEFGSTFYPLLRYQKGGELKAFPDIGDVIGPDNILIALRKHSVCTNGMISNTNALSVAEMSMSDMKKVNHLTDRVYYGAGPGGRVIDIRIYHDPNNSSGLIPEGLEEQPLKYHNATRSFYREILDEYERMRRERGEFLKISPAFHRLLVEAIAISGSGESKIKKEFKKNPLDEWRIEFDIEYDIVPDVGFKLTDCHGGKKSKDLS